MKTADRSDLWMVLAVLVCLAGSVPRGIGEPIPTLRMDSDQCWFSQLEEKIHTTVSDALSGVAGRLRVLPLIDRHGRPW